MKSAARALVLVLAAMLAMGANDALARGRGHGHWSGSRSGAWHGGGHHHRHFVAGFYFGYPWYAWSPYPYSYGPPFYYAPDYVARVEPPTVYIEKFDGTPSADTQGFILCPSSDTAYPETKECPGGWARALPAPATR